MAKHVPSALAAGFPAVPGLFASILQGAFQELDIGVSTCTGQDWRALYVSPVMTAMEVERGVEPLRYRYNLRSIRQIRRTRRIVHGELFGLHDLFVPVIIRRQLATILVTGPFATSRPSSAEVLDRWYAMTGEHGRVTDPAFLRYLTFTLGTLTLEGPLLDAFERMMTCFARLVAGEGESNAIAVEAQRLHNRLVEARQVDRMWADASSMVDERTAHTWMTGLKRDPRKAMGLDRPPKHAWVGLLVRRGANDDPVGEVIARDAVQRAMVAFARNRGHVASGKVGDRGFTLLTDSQEAGARARAVLNDLSIAAAPIARRFGFKLHVGIALADKSSTLPTCYRGALAAAEKALTRGTSFALAGPRQSGSLQELRHLRANLGIGVEEHPSHLSTRFERYMSAVLSHTGYRADAARWHLQAGLERLAEPLLASGALERRSFDEICDGSDSISDTDSVADLALSCRRVVVDIERAIEIPTEARQGRSIRRALRFMQEHLPERLTLERVARVAGFAPDYFSMRLKHQEGLTFEQYLQRHRLERAKHLLSGTSMSIGRVAQLSGFQSRTTFQRLFKRSTGETPAEYRRV